MHRNRRFRAATYHGRDIYWTPNEEKIHSAEHHEVYDDPVGDLKATITRPDGEGGRYRVECRIRQLDNTIIASFDVWEEAHEFVFDWFAERLKEQGVKPPLVCQGCDVDLHQGGVYFVRHAEERSYFGIDVFGRLITRGVQIHYDGAEDDDGGWGHGSVRCWQCDCAQGGDLEELLLESFKHKRAN